MKEQIETLIQLQRIEKERAALQTQIAEIPRREQALDEQLGAAEDEITRKKERIDEVRKQYRAFESDVRANQDRIDKSRARLGTIKTNKEYQAMLKEIEELRKKNSKIEDEMLDFLDQIEAAEGEAASEKEKHDRLKAETDGLKKTLREEADDASRRMGQLDLHWRQVSEAIDPALLKRFQMVRQKVGPITLAPVSNAVCGGCNLNIPHQLFNELQRFDSLKYCPHCQRLIFWEKPLEENNG